MAITYEPISTTTLGSATSDITFSSISSAYTDLRLVLNVASSTSGVSITLRYNSDSGANYAYTRIYGDGTTAASDRVTGGTSIASMSLTGGTGIFSLQTIDIFSYRASIKKAALISTNNNAASGRVRAAIGLWNNTDAITSITVSAGAATFEAGSMATLYGILKA